MVAKSKGSHVTGVFFLFSGFTNLTFTIEGLEEKSREFNFAGWTERVNVNLHFMTTLL